MFREIGIMDEFYTSGYEDSEFSWRATLAGWKTEYAPDAIIYHKRSATIKELYDKDSAYRRSLDLNASRPCKTHGTSLQKFQFVLFNMQYAIRSYIGYLAGRNKVGAGPFLVSVRQMFKE